MPVGRWHRPEGDGAATPAPLSRWQAVGFILLLTAAAGLLVPNIERYPATWFDEGWWLQNSPQPRAARPLCAAQRGRVQADRHGRAHLAGVLPAGRRGVRAVRRRTAAGPPGRRRAVHDCGDAGVRGHPAALSGLGRTAGAGPFRLHPARRLLDRAAALRPSDDGRGAGVDVVAGRRLFWLRWRDTERAWPAAIAGVCVATCAAVKPQFGIVLVPTLPIMWAAEWWGRGRLPRFAWVIPAAMIATAAAHVLLLVALLGPADFGQLLAGFAAASGPQVRMFLQPSTVRRALGLAARSRVQPAPAAGRGLRPPSHAQQARGRPATRLARPCSSASGWSGSRWRRRAGAAMRFRPSPSGSSQSPAWSTPSCSESGAPPRRRCGSAPGPTWRRRLPPPPSSPFCSASTAPPLPRGSSGRRRPTPSSLPRT